MKEYHDIQLTCIDACSTYFTQPQSDAKTPCHSEATLAEVHRLPLGSRSGISPTSSGHILLDSILTSVFTTGTREGMVGSSVSLWPAQCDTWEVWVKGVIVNCIAITCEMNFESVQFKQCSSRWIYLGSTYQSKWGYIHKSGILISKFEVVLLSSTQLYSPRYELIVIVIPFSVINRYLICI